MSRLQKARQAFKKHNSEQLAKIHQLDEVIAANYKQDSLILKHMGNIINGGGYGLLSSLLFSTILFLLNFPYQQILGLGLVFGITSSLALSSWYFLNLLARNNFYELEKKRENYEIDHFPEAQKEELRQIYLKEGLAPGEVENLIEALTATKSLWINTMLKEEAQIDFNSHKSIVLSALFFFISAFFANTIPLMPFGISSLNNPLLILGTACFLSIILGFLLGFWRTHLTATKGWFGGIQNSLIVFFSFLIVYYLTIILENFII